MTEAQKGKTHKRLSIHDKQVVLDHYKNGLNGREIHEVTGLSYGAINYYLSKVKKRRGGVVHAEKEIIKATYPKTNTRRPVQKVSEEMLDKMVEMWNSGVQTYSQIGEAFGIADVTAAKYLKQRGCYKEGQVQELYSGTRSPVAPRSKKAVVTPEMTQKFIEMYNKGRSSGEIAGKFNVGRSTVERYLTMARRANGTDNHSRLEKYSEPTPNTGSLIDELKAEIRAEIKAELLKEMLGKK